MISSEKVASHGVTWIFDLLQAQIDWESIKRVYGQQMADDMIKECFQQSISLEEAFKVPIPWTHGSSIPFTEREHTGSGRYDGYNNLCSCLLCSNAADSDFCLCFSP